MTPLRKYQLIKKDEDGKVYDTAVANDTELVKHLDGMFRFTHHELIAVVCILPSSKPTINRDAAQQHVEWFKQMLIDNGTPENIKTHHVKSSAGFKDSERAFLAGKACQ